MRLGIYGGSFDPVHYGHLLLAECCREQANLDEVWFVPAATPPHKQPGRLASPAARIEMLQLAIGGHAAFRVSSLETDRGGVSYTVDTLAAVREARPDDDLFFLMGADSLADLPTWREPQRVCQLATPLVVCRPGSPRPDLSVLSELMEADEIARVERSLVDMPQIGLSSTELRERAAVGHSLRFRTPRAVEAYIEAQRLYR